MSSSSKFRGFFNKYRKQMPLIEILLKDVSYAVLWTKNFIRNGFKSKTILVHPHYPSRGSTLYKAGRMLGYNITNKMKSDVKFAVYWEYLTFREEYQYLEKVSANKKVLNLHSRNISKVFVDEKHKEAFGYSTIIDPLTYSGSIVKKNDINAMHDGEILQGPLDQKDDDYIYQILIDNTHSDKLVMDMRVPIVGEVLDFAYLKYRDITERFKNTTTHTEVVAIDTILSTKEIQTLNRFCQLLQLEYGELDVLRNKEDNKIYVVDVNNTPQGPPANTSKEDGKKALKKIGETLSLYAGS